MATVCYTRATLTSARLITTYSVITSSRNVLSVSPGHTSYYLYSSTSCTVRSSWNVCSTYRSTRISIVPPRTFTTVSLYYSSRPVYITSFTTLYSRSCSVSRPTPEPPRPATPTVTRAVTTTAIKPVTTTAVRPVTVTADPGTFTVTVGTSDVTTTTEVTGVTVPTTITEVSGFTVATTATETSVVTPLPAGGGVSGASKLPVGVIVGGVLGGVAVAVLLGTLIYHFCFRKTKSLTYDTDGRNLQHQQSISLSAIDRQSSPSEGSSGLQLQENGARRSSIDVGQTVRYHTTSQESHNMTAQVGQQYNYLPEVQDGALHSNVAGRQTLRYPTSKESLTTRPGHQYTHVRQDSLGGVAGAAAARPRSTSTDQGYYYPQPSAGLYLGHAEVQDSRW